MAVRQELWCSSMVPTGRFSYSKSADYAEHRPNSAARVRLEELSSTRGRESVKGVSSMEVIIVKAHPSRKQTENSVVCTNDSQFLVQRRDVMQLCFFSGFFSSGLTQQNGVIALEGDGANDDGGRALKSSAEVGLANGRLRSCEGSACCVSTSAFRSPSRFMPPWQYLGPQKDAYEELLKALKRMGAEIMKTEVGRYVYATLSTSSSRDDIDDLEFLFVGNVVCFRSFSRKTVLDPPFCWWPGCINGPGNRGRMEALRDDLGWIPLETDEDKAWTPIFLH
ncbi:unnamed protein product [Calypogeia fissa]